MTDEAVLAAIAAEAGWMEDLLVRLVEAPTVPGAEEAGQEVMETAFAGCGLATRSVPLDAGDLRAAGASPFTWEVEGERNVVVRDCDWLSGRGAGGIHGIDERASLPSVVESAQVLGLFVKDWCGLVRGSDKEER